MSIGENIKQIRKKQKMTQKELAEKCGMYDSQIRKYETNRVTPKADSLIKIADALGVDPQYLDQRLAVKVYTMLNGTEVAGNPYVIDMARKHDEWEVFREFLNFNGVSCDNQQKNLFTFEDTGERFLVNEPNLTFIAAELIKTLIRVLGKDPTPPDPE